MGYVMLFGFIFYVFFILFPSSFWTILIWGIAIYTVLTMWHVFSAKSYMDQKTRKRLKWENSNADYVLWKRAAERDRLEKIRLEKKSSFDPQKFEVLVADVFRVYGYHVIETPYQGDHGIDLKIIKSNEYALVQCKRYAGTVGEPIIRDFFGCMQHENADFGYVVTTGRFTKNAYVWAKGKNIMLIDGDALQKMINETNKMKNKKVSP